jgi:hypothetical protein
MEETMTKVLKTTLATAFAAACLAGASMSFAADNGGTNLNKGTSSTRLKDSTYKDMDSTTTGSIKCDNSNANINSGCDKPGHLKQEERMQQDQ